MVVPSLSPPSPAKVALRADMRAKRRAFVAALSADERTAGEAALLDRLKPLIAHARVVAGYHAMGSEIDPDLALRWAMDHGVSAAMPAFLTATSPMIFRSGQCAEDCPVGGVQPPPQAREVKPDLVLVPLVAADRFGNRLGQGGGHYDRALPALRAMGARIVGIGWDMQLLDSPIVPDHWDIPLDAFASPAGLMEFT